MELTNTPKEKQMEEVVVTSKYGTAVMRMPEGWVFDPDRWARAFAPIAQALEDADQTQTAA